MENRGKKTLSEFPSHGLAAQRFYEKYWQKPQDAIPTKDPTNPKRLELLSYTLEKIGAGKKVLDAGCGYGFFTNAIEKAGYKAVGMDISENTIAEARRKYPDIEFFCNALDARWPFEDGTFDVIFSTEVIEHVLGTYELFAEMNRVLEARGTLVLTTPYHGLIKNLLIVLFGFDRHFNNIEGGHIRFFTDKFLKTLLNQFGFEIIETKYIGRVKPIAKSLYVVAKKTRDL